MTFDEYQYQAIKYVNPALDLNQQMIDGAMGLCGEAGETIELIKKHIGQGHGLSLAALAEEIGDALWYMAELAGSQGIRLDDIAAKNLRKIQQRYPEGFDASRSISRG